MEQQLLLEQLLKKAVQLQATDIHIDPDHSPEITYRRNKIFLRTARMDPSLYDYLKYQANLDLSRATLPQTGSVSIHIGRRALYLRVSVIETFGRRSAVIRIMNAFQPKSLESLCMDTDVCQTIREAVTFPNGLIIFCGSTGSGKSTTMFTLLNEIKQLRIYTLEDPVEQIHESLVQLQVNQSIGLDFEQGMMQLLRHDPDLIVLGELRKEQEARTAIRCALTGHRVMATLHVNDPGSVGIRLLDLGCHQYELQACIRLIVFQRMVHEKRVTQFLMFVKALGSHILQASLNDDEATLVRLLSEHGVPYEHIRHDYRLKPETLDTYVGLFYRRQSNIYLFVKQKLNLIQALSYAQSILRVRRKIKNHLKRQLTYPLLLWGVSFVLILFVVKLLFPMLLSMAQQNSGLKHQMNHYFWFIRCFLWLHVTVSSIVLIIWLLLQKTAWRILIFDFIHQKRMFQFFRTYLSFHLCSTMISFAEMGFSTRDMITMFRKGGFTPMLRWIGWHLEDRLEQGMTYQQVFYLSYLDPLMQQFLMVQAFDKPGQSSLQELLTLLEVRMTHALKQITNIITFSCYVYICLLVYQIYQLIYLPLSILEGL